MSRRAARLALVVALAAGLAAGCGSAGDVESSATREDRPGAAAGPDRSAAGWIRIEADGGTTCARGTPYSFWFRAGRMNRLLVYFQSGGACWDAATCRPGSEYFKDVAGRFDDPAQESGIFDLENPENPFRDYSMVYVPYCTGDGHWGDEVTVYEGEGQHGGRVRIRHKGFVNGSAAMEWAYDRVEDPEAVFVAGCSAGSIGSILFAAYAARHYEDARLVQLGDSEAFVFDRPVDLQSDWGAHDNFPEWIPALAHMEPGDFSMARFYTAVASAYPEHVFAQYSTAHDSVQIRYFLAAGDSSGRWEDELAASLGEIHAGAPNFRSYLAEGGGHCILQHPRFYSETVGGVRFRDWAAALAEGRDVRNVQCAECPILALAAVRSNAFAGSGRGD